ncbi:hypothetical protein [Microcystis aeruginosa]|uniref:Uncharacterized protein n=1 Tax=Microcystis aeruginosa (strain NIES-843 / IAM M-2473) TaxID=449447 RepID=B0JP22_MICAN|nr:hypothetical protein [Microcystis aeruginosa]BAG00333.1 unknown protein [Microcystis aeruginosa NIES-843]
MEVPYYDARGDKLSIAVNDLNEQIAAKIEELEIENVEIYFARLQLAFFTQGQ